MVKWLFSLVILLLVGQAKMLKNNMNDGAS